MPQKIKNATKRFIKVLILTFITNTLLALNIGYMEYVRMGTVDMRMLIALIIASPVLSGIIAAVDKWLRWEEDEDYKNQFINKIYDKHKRTERNEEDKYNKEDRKEERYQEDKQHERSAEDHDIAAINRVHRNEEDKLHNNLK